MHENQLWVNQPLPYAYDALEPYIDEQTMCLHHDQHLQAYVDHLNEALAPYPKFQCLSLERLICMAGRLPPKVGIPIARNAGGVYNHRFYFDGMTPEGPDQPDGALAQAMDRRFGSFAAFQEAFAAAAEGVFGSGYGWLGGGPPGTAADPHHGQSGHPADCRALSHLERGCVGARLLLKALQ